MHPIQDILLKKEDIEKIDSLDILASSNDAGVYLVAEKDGSRFLLQDIQNMIQIH